MTAVGRPTHSSHHPRALFAQARGHRPARGLDRDPPTSGAAWLGGGHRGLRILRPKVQSAPGRARTAPRTMHTGGMARGLPASPRA